MSRRPLVLLTLVAASFVASACADITAPKRDEVPTDPTQTCTTWGGSTGLTCIK